MTKSVECTWPLLACCPNGIKRKDASLAALGLAAVVPLRSTKPVRRTDAQALTSHLARLRSALRPSESMEKAAKQNPLETSLTQVERLSAGNRLLCLQYF